MTSVQQSTLHVEGASIFYRSCGRGPPVLILAGGDADADATDPLRNALTERHRVITYDRRGLSRSRPDPGAAAADIATHAEDASRLLAALTDEPACVFGAGIGGLIGLDLVARHPEQVKMLVAHETPAVDVLPETEAQAFIEMQHRVLFAYRAHGLAAALRQKAEFEGLDPEDREPDAAPLAMTPQREANLAVLLSRDLPAAIAHTLDIPALDVHAHRIVPAAGVSTRRTLPHRCASALAEVLERPLALFPGGHTGWLLRPKAFAAHLAQIFAQADRRDWRLGDGAAPRSSGRA